MNGHLCAAPHTRFRDRGELYELPNGTTVRAEGVERVTDMQHAVPAADGARLCVGHVTWLTQLVKETPEMVRWLRANVHHGSMPQGNSEGSSGTKAGSQAPCNVDAIDAADLELTTLARWAVAAGLGHVPGPVYRRNGVVAGLRKGDRGPVGFLTGFLLARMGQIVQAEWAAEFLEDLAGKRGRHLSRWPLTDEKRRNG
ncbi:hypothetical protein GS966_11185 [Rhodococcus hoagii]|nr:hypothetical protein [Prescottella equi]